jgi:CRISPR-associated endonuclease Csn1
MSDSKIVLGLDPGVKSIGWALIEEHENGDFTKLIDSGSVIFKPIFEPQHFKMLNTTRTEQRQARKQRDRKKRRLSKLENFLIKHKILSTSIENLESQGNDIQSILGNPYQLRTKALDELLTGDELSYIILHLFRRRGFLSSLKSKTAAEKKTDALASDVMNKMRSAKCRTLGEYFYNQNDGKKNRNRIRNSSLKTESERELTGEGMLRDNLELELDMILECQSKSGHNQLNAIDESTGVIVKEEILSQFRFQRPLKPQKKRVFCPLERKSYYDKSLKKEINKGLPCANKLTAYSQKFIILQTINNIKITYRGDDAESNHTLPLTQKQKETVFDKLWKSKEIKFSSLRKALKIDESALVNFEFGDNTTLQGNQLYGHFKGIVAKYFKTLNYETLNEILKDIHTIKGAECQGLETRLKKYWKLDSSLIEAIIEQVSSITPSYMSYSKKAIEKLIPEMESGLLTHAAVDSIYGTKDQTETDIVAKLPPFKLTTNKILNKSVTEVRHLVNAIIDKYGKIDVVRLELTRELGLGSARLLDLKNEQSKNEKLNTAAADFLSDNTYTVNKTNIDKYKLWKESKCKSLYPELSNGNWAYKSISADELFGTNSIYEIEHIYPKSISGDNSFVNKSICKSSINLEKGNRTPYDYYKSKGMKQDDLDNMIKNAYSKTSRNKGRRFAKTTAELREEITSSSTLNTTGYIANQLKDYLSFICEPKNIECSKGGYTAMLRHELNLNVLLGDSNKKSRLDHRHHMVDALVIAMTSKNNIECLNKIRRLSMKDIQSKSHNYLDKKSYLNRKYKIRQDFVDKFDRTLTYHEIENKVSGAIDNDTIYSLMRSIKNEFNNSTYHKLEKINLKDIEKIEDIDKHKFENCLFVYSIPWNKDIAGKTISSIKLSVESGKLVFPKEVIEYIFTTKDSVMPNYFVLKNGNQVKKVKQTRKKTSPKTAHLVKNKQKLVIGFKRTDSNFCVNNLITDEDTEVIAKYYGKKEEFLNDNIYKGSILKIKNEFFRVYKLLVCQKSSSVFIAPVNNTVIEGRDVIKNGVKINSKKCSLSSLKKGIKSKDIFFINGNYFYET